MYILWWNKFDDIEDPFVKATENTAFYAMLHEQSEQEYDPQSPYIFNAQTNKFDRECETSM